MSSNAKNPKLESLLRELDRSKILTARDLVKRTPRPPCIDFAIRNRLNIVKKRKNNTSTPSLLLLFFLLPSQPPLPLPPPTEPLDLPSPPCEPPPSPHSNQIIPPRPPLLPPSLSFHFPTQPTFPSNNFFGFQTQTLTRERGKTKYQGPLDGEEIYELPELPKIELDGSLANVLGTEGEEILEKELED